MSAAMQPTILLVPGAFTTPACYDLVSPYLHSHGYPVVVASLPSSTLTNPEEHTATTDGSFLLDRFLMPLLKDGKDVVVFAHSFGATCLSGAGQGLSKAERGRNGLPGGVVGLVYISFAMAKDGQSQLEFLGGAWPPFCKPNSPSKGLLVFDPVIDTLFNDATPERQRELAATHLPHSLSVFETPVSCPLWTDPALEGRRVMIKTLLDATFPAAAQELFANTCGARWDVIDIKAGHEAILTKAEDISRIIVESTRLFREVQ